MLLLCPPSPSYLCLLSSFVNKYFLLFFSFHFSDTSILNVTPDYICNMSSEKFLFNVFPIYFQSIRTSSLNYSSFFFSIPLLYPIVSHSFISWIMLSLLHLFTIMLCWSHTPSFICNSQLVSSLQFISHLYTSHWFLCFRHPLGLVLPSFYFVDFLSFFKFSLYFYILSKFYPSFYR